MERHHRLRFRLRARRRAAISLRERSAARSHLIHAPERRVIAIGIDAVGAVVVRPAILPPIAIGREGVLVAVGILDGYHPDIVRCGERGSRIREPADQRHRDRGRYPLARMMRAHEQDVGTIRHVIRWSDLHCQNRPTFVRGAYGIDVNAGVRRGPRRECCANAVARPVERAIHPKGVGGPAGRDPRGSERRNLEAAPAQQQLRLGRDDDHGALRAVDDADVGDFEAEARQGIEARATGNRHLHDAQLRRRGRDGSERQQR